MASANAGNSGKKKTSSKPAATRKTKGNGRSTANTRTSHKKSKEMTALQDEIFLLAVIAFAVILLLSCFNLAGSFGSIINRFMFGMIGVVEYILPIVLVVSVFFVMANKQLAVVKIKTAAVFVMLTIISALAQMFSGKPDINAGIMEFFEYSSDYHRGGGLIGALWCKLLSVLGAGGTYVMLILLLIICAIFITERSIIKGIKAGGSRFLNTAKDDYEYYKEHSRDMRMQQDEALEEEEERYRERTEQRRLMRERRLEEKRQREAELAAKPRRTSNKVKGVVLNNELNDTDVMPTPLAAGDLEEVTLNFNEEPSIFKIEDEYSKDIYDPNDLKHTSHEAKASSSKEESSGMTEITVASEADDSWNPNVASDTGTDVDSSNNGAHVLSDIMPRNTNSGQVKKEAAVPAKENASGNSKAAYVFPPIELLTKGANKSNSNLLQENKKTALKLQQTLQNFGVRVTITDISCGPAVTRYELQPEQGTKVAKIVSLSDDIKLNLAAADIRIEAPIPGKAAIGIEVPNKETASVSLRELLESQEFKKHPSSIAFAAGKDIAGKTIVADIGKMPHLLIAGATGSGKSVCINTIIMSILYKAAPDEVRLIMIDPKVVELSVYNGIPHLMIPVVTDPKKASAALNWAVAEMTARYQKFAELNVRDIKGYNEKLMSMQAPEGMERPGKMPQIVIIIDELADLMMVAPGEVEDAICRLAQLARAAGIHLVIATQRPSVNVITGLIKANVPSRIAFAVSSGVDSRTIIDMNGAEKLLGKGDMLFYPQGYPKPVRVQGAFVSDKEVGAVVDFLSQHVSASYDENAASQIQSGVSLDVSSSGGAGDRDEYFAEAGRFIIEKEKASIGMLQRYYKIGFNRAARIMDQLCEAGVVGPEEGTKPRKILMQAEEFEEYLRRQ